MWRQMFVATSFPILMGRRNKMSHFEMIRFY